MSLTRRQLILLPLAAAASVIGCSPQQPPTIPVYNIPVGNKKVDLEQALSVIYDATPIGKNINFPVLADLAASAFSEAREGDDWVKKLGEKYGWKVTLEVRILNDYHERKDELSGEMYWFQRPVLYFDSSLKPAQFVAHFLKQSSRLCNGGYHRLASLADSHYAAARFAGMHPQFIQENNDNDILFQVISDLFTCMDNDVPDSADKRDSLSYLDSQAAFYSFTHSGLRAPDLKQQPDYFKNIGLFTELFLRDDVNAEYLQDPKSFRAGASYATTKRTEEFFLGLNPKIPDDKQLLLGGKMESLRNKFSVRANLA